jgi:hypothetical protein
MISINKVFVLILTVFAISLLSFVIIDSDEPLVKVKYKSKFDFIVKGGIDVLVHTFTDSFSVFSAKDYTIYEFPMYKSVFQDGIEVSFRSLSSYFYFKNNEKTGIYLDSLRSLNFKKCKVDSILNIYGFTNFVFYDKDSLTKHSSTILPSGDIKERYVTNFVRDVNYSDTNVFYFTKKKYPIAYSFSKELEDEKNMQIYRLECIFNKRKYGNNSSEVPKRSFVFTLKEEYLDDDFKKVIKKFGIN